MPDVRNAKVSNCYTFLIQWRWWCLSGKFTKSWETSMTLRTTQFVKNMASLKYFKSRYQTNEMTFINLKRTTVTLKTSLKRFWKQIHSIFEQLSMNPRKKVRHCCLCFAINNSKWLERVNVYCQWAIFYISLL